MPTVELAEVEVALEALQPGDVVSFDVFDTLIARCLHVDFVHHAMAARVAALRGTTADAEFGRRRALEQSLHAEARTRGDGEYVLGALYEAWLEGRDDVGAFVAQELALEATVLRATTYGLAWVRRAVARGASVVFSTEMYLSSDQVLRLLEGCGYERTWFAAGFSSADSNRYKRTGRLFELLTERLAVAPGRVLHVGDSYEADGNGASLAGVRGVVFFSKTLEEHRRRSLAWWENARRGDAERALLEYRLCERAVFGRTSAFEGRYGATVFGPIFVAAMRRLLDWCERRRHRRVYFLARDGFLLRRVFEVLQASMPPEARIESRYLCLSRLPVIRALLSHGLTLKVLTVGKHYLVPQDRTLRNLLRFLGFDAVAVGVAALESGLGSVDLSLDDWLWNRPAFLAFCQHRIIRAEAARIGAESAQLLEAYLRQEGCFEGEELVLCDIGWGGNIQDQLRDLLPERINLTGYYLALNSAGFERRRSTSWMEPLLASQVTRWPSTPLGNAVPFQWSGPFEDACRGLHGTTLGFASAEGVLTPVLRETGSSREKERRSEGALARFQQGILWWAEAARSFGEVLQSTPRQSELMAMTAMVRLFHAPERAEAAFWRSVTHTNDLGALDIIEEWVSPTSWRTLRRTLKTSLWKQGVAAELGMPPLTALVAARHAVRYAKHQQASINLAFRSLLDGVRAVSPVPAPASRLRTPSDEVFDGSRARADALAREPGLDGPVLGLVTPQLLQTLSVLVGIGRLVPRKLVRGVPPANDGVPLRLLWKALREPEPELP